MASNQSNVPIEMIEADYPLRVEQYGFAPDTGRPGRVRGGLGILRQYKVLTDDVYFGVRSDKADFPPHGLFGGGAGRADLNLVNRGPIRRVLPTMPTEPVTLQSGDVFRHVMAGGGGYGDPLERDPLLLREDLLDGKMTAGHAAEFYGVVVHGTEIDLEATRRLRAERRAGEHA